MKLAIFSLALFCSGPSFATEYRDVVPLVRIYNPRSDQVISSGVGSGILISNDGYILTAKHLFRDYDPSIHIIQVFFNGLDSHPATAQHEDCHPRTVDACIIRVRPSVVRSIVRVPLLSCRRLAPQERVLSVGWPYGAEQMELNQASGEVTSALSLDGLYPIAGGLALNGMSGGPVFDGHGHVVGLVRGGIGAGQSQTAFVPMFLIQSLFLNTTVRCAPGSGGGSSSVLPEGQAVRPLSVPPVQARNAPAPSHSELGRRALAEGRFETAVDELKISTLEDPNNATNYINLALARRYVDDTMTQALADAHRAQQLSSSPEARLAIGLLRALRGEDVQAIEAFEAAIARDRNMRQTIEAELSEMINSSRLSWARRSNVARTSAIVQERAGRHQAALSEILRAERFIAGDQRNADVRRRLERRLAVVSQPVEVRIPASRPQQATPPLHEVVAARPTERESADSLAEQGRSAYETEQFRTAISLYTRAIVLEPNRFDLYVLRADAHQRLNDLTAALRDADRAVRQGPREPSAHNIRGVVLGRLDRQQEALHALDNAVRLDPSYAPARRNRADVRRALGRFADARSDIDEAIRLDRTNTRNRLLRARIYEGEGRLTDALTDYRFVASRSRNVEAHEALQRLARRS